jgi:hypothetical protein
MEISLISNPLEYSIIFFLPLFLSISIVVVLITQKKLTENFNSFIYIPILNLIFGVFITILSGNLDTNIIIVRGISIHIILWYIGLLVFSSILLFVKNLKT